MPKYIDYISKMAETISIKKVYDELKDVERKMVTRKEMRSLIDTISMMGNPETMKQIAESMHDIENGRVKEVNSAKDLINEI